MDIVANAFVQLWFNAYGSPKIVAPDVEFMFVPFKDTLRNTLRETASPWSQNIAIVECGHNEIRLLVQGIIQDGK